MLRFLSTVRLVTATVRARAPVPAPAALLNQRLAPNVLSVQSRKYTFYNSNRIRNSLALDGKTVLYGLIATNVGIWGLWQLAYDDMRWRRFMYQNFTVNLPNALMRPWTIITSNFSHRELPHLAVNMLALYTFAQGILAVVNGQRLLTLYLLSGIASAAGCIMTTKVNCLGASGSISAIMFAFATLFPKAYIIVLIFPMPSWAAAGLFVCYDLFYLKANDNTAHGGHLAGALYGFVYGLLLRRRI